MLPLNRGGYAYALLMSQTPAWPLSDEGIREFNSVCTLWGVQIHPHL